MTVETYLTNHAALLAGTRDYPAVLNGITSGPGNQGSANVAMNQGHAGTGLGRLAVPMQLKSGGTTIGVGP